MRLRLDCRAVKGAATDTAGTGKQMSCLFAIQNIIVIG